MNAPLTIDRYVGVLRFSFGDNPKLADELLALVLAGKKTATCCALEQAKREGWIMKPGDISIARDSTGRDRCVIETVEATTRRFNEVDAAFAFDEGEDDRTLQSWRREHGLYFARNGGWSEDMVLYCERFRVVEVLP
jgi:uncharacterized protein YhfF